MSMVLKRVGNNVNMEQFDDLDRIGAMLGGATLQLW